MFRNLSPLCLVMIIFCFGVPVAGQEKAISVPIVASPTSNDRIQDRLSGPVRRVRVETARALLRHGKTIEGPRVSEAVITYDPLGKRLESTSNSTVQTTPMDKEQYRYDEKGNIIETGFLAVNGSLISKERFHYEFDEFGNWKRKIKLVAVYENGNISYEPVEVTYRTITYYFDQTVARLTTGSRNGVDRTSAPPALTTNGLDQTSALPAVTTNGLAHEGSSVEHEVAQASNEVEILEANKAVGTNGAVPDAQLKNVSPTTLPTKEVTATPAVVHRSEEALRKSLIELPAADYPVEAERAKLEGKVEVQVIINEKGEVTNARAISGNPLLTEAAARAVSKARFSPNKLNSQSARVFGLLTYEFSLRQRKPGGPDKADAQQFVVGGSESKAAKDATPVRPPEGSSLGTGNAPSSLAASTSSAKSQPTISAQPVPQLTVFGAAFERGMASLKSADYKAAVQSFQEFIRLNPNDALAYYKLGFAYSALGKHQETIAAYKKALRLNRAFATADSFYRLGSAYLAVGNHTAAIEPLNQAIYSIRAQVFEPEHKPVPGDPSQAEAHYALGLSYYGSDAFREATKEFESAVRLRPDFAPAHYALGLALLAIGDKRAAEREEAALRRLRSPLANKLAGALLTPAAQRNRVF